MFTIHIQTGHLRAVGKYSFAFIFHVIPYDQAVAVLQLATLVTAAKVKPSSTFWLWQSASRCGCNNVCQQHTQTPLHKPR